MRPRRLFLSSLSRCNHRGRPQVSCLSRRDHGGRSRLFCLLRSISPISATETDKCSFVTAMEATFLTLYLSFCFIKFAEINPSVSLSAGAPDGLKPASLPARLCWSSAPPWRSSAPALPAPPAPPWCSPAPLWSSALLWWFSAPPESP